MIFLSITSGYIRRSIYVTLLLCRFLVTNVYAQGCSDAGFCTAGAMQGGQKANDTITEKSSIGISASLGRGENGVIIVSPQVEGKLHFTPATYIEAKLPLVIVSGNLGHHIGPGDPIITCTHLLSGQSRVSLIATVGARIGVGSSNASYNGVALPMPYQNSLGSSDLIAGIGAAYGKYLKMSAGYQQPVIQYNRNGYQPAFVYPSKPGAYDYFASSELKRRADVLIRVEGQYQWRKILIAAGPLFIYHLGEDTYTTATGSSARLSGSGGTTLNIAASLSYFTKDARFEFQGGEPLVVRDYRPDGLTRSFVLAPRYTRYR